MENEIESICPNSRQAWREWLEANHESKQAVWLIYYKKKSNLPTVLYSDAVDEALCFGWIDSKAKPIDEEKYMQFFTKRKPKSIWSRINKEKIEQRKIESKKRKKEKNERIIREYNEKFKV